MFLIVVAAVAACLLCGCSDGAAKPTKNTVTVTLLNGEHYSVIGNNKVDAVDGQPVIFDIRVEKGYDVVGHYGDGLKVSIEPSFTKKVTFTDVQYKTVARLETLPLDMVDFKAVSKDVNYGDISVETVLGEAEQNVYYENDVLDISVTPNDGYRFLCWSTGSFLSDGGEFFSYESRLTDFDFNAHSILYANFKDITNTENTIYYRFEDGVEIEQDCTALLAHHARANTLTASDVTAHGIDFDGKMLAGWQTQDGVRVGLGSRVTVSKSDVNILLPVWKEYTDSSLFTVTADGKITSFSSDANVEEVVVPRSVGQTTVTAIGAYAFENCTASAFFLPDTITTVENNAFLNCEKLTDLYMSDNIAKIDDKAFIGCKNFTTLHLNAVLKPRYFSYNSIKAELYDELIVNADNGSQKLVLFGGSSVRHGYSEKAILESFDCSELIAPKVYNMGLAVDAGVHCMYELAKPYLRKGDIVLHAPEIADRSWSGRFTLSPLTGEKSYEVNYRIFEVSEPNWGLLNNLTVNKYCNLFAQLCKFNTNRTGMRERSYTDYYKYVADDEYGVRKNTEYVKQENGTDKSFGNNGKINYEVDLADNIDAACNDIYMYLNAIDVKIFVAFPPINKQTLLLTYQDEQTIRYAAEGYMQNVRSLLSAVDYTLLLTPYDTVYDGRHFSDSDYHLGDPFRNEHTKKVVTAMIDKLLQDNNHGGGYSLWTT